MQALRVFEGGSLSDEAAAIASAADGDVSARDWLVRKWTPPVWRFCARMLGDEQDASDLTQDILLKVLANLERYDRGRSFSTWVFGIARNACIDEHRRRSHRRHDPIDEVADAAPSVLHQITREQRAQQLRDALDQLPTMYKEVLVLYHFEHLKYAEIAEILDLPMGTVMNRIFRARQKVRALIDGEEA